MKSEELKRNIFMEKLEHWLLFLHVTLQWVSTVTLTEILTYSTLERKVDLPLTVEFQILKCLASL